MKYSIPRVRAARAFIRYSVAFFVATHAVLASTNTFKTGTSWNTATDWSAAHVPAAADALLISGTYYGAGLPTLTLDNSFAVQSLSFNTGTDSFSINANASGTTARTLTFGGGANALGGAAIIATSQATSGAITLGGTPGTGSLILAFGGNTATVNIAGSAGTLILGANSDVTGTNGLTLTGSGALILGGANAYSGNTTVAGGTLGIAGKIYTPGNFLFVDGSNGYAPTASLSGTAVLSVESAYIGKTGTGNFIQTGGSNTAADYLIIGRYAGAGGAYKLSGGSVSSPNTYIGYAGAGSFLQTGGTNAAGGLVLGLSSGGNGSYTLSGGLLKASSITAGAGSSVFNFNGGTLMATGTSGYFMDALGSADIQSGGAIINTNGFANTIPQMLAHDPTPGAPAIDGGLTKSGSGTLTLSGPDTYTGPTNVNAGTLAITGGIDSPNASLTVDGSIANAPLATLSSGASLLALNDYLGFSGTGTFSQTGGAATLNDYVFLGYNGPGSGSYNLSGGTLTSTHIFAGWYGTGAFTQTGGTNSATAYLVLGRYAGGTGLYNFSAGLVSTSNAIIGWSGTGNFIQTGGVNTDGTMVLGQSAGGAGMYNLSAGSVSITNAIVGASGSGAFIQTGGTNTVNALVLGQSAGGTGTYQLNGGTNTDNALVLGQSAGGAGTYELNGGTLAAFSVTGGSGTSVLDFNGGTLQATASNSAFITHLTTINAGSAGMLVNPNGYSIGIPGTLNVSGTLVETGSGTLTLSGSCTFAAVNVTAGTLAITGSVNSSIVVNGTPPPNEPLATLGPTGYLKFNNLDVSVISYPDGAGVVYGSAFAQTGGTAIGTNLCVGVDYGSAGTYTLEGGFLQVSSATIANGGTLGIGFQPDIGTFVQTGGTFNVLTSMVMAPSSNTEEYGGQSYAYFNQSGGYFSSPSVIVGSTVGNKGDGGGIGSFDQTGGVCVVPTYNSTGTYTLAGGIFLTATASAGAFYFDGGTIEASGSNTVITSPSGIVQSGGAFLNTNHFTMSVPGSLQHDSSSGAPAIDGGLTVTGSGTLVLPAAESYTGPTNIDGGSLVLTGQVNAPNSNFTIDGRPADPASVNLGYSGSSGAIVALNEYVGNTGTGSIIQSGGSNTMSQYLFLGYYGGSGGSYNLGAGLLQSTHIFDGWYGTGAFVQTGGTNNASSYLVLGRYAGSNGTYNLSAGSLSTANDDVGWGGAASFIQTGGANTSGALVLGESAGGSGTYELNGGTLATAGISGGGGASIFDFDGGTLLATASNAAFMTGITTVNVQPGGAIVNTNGFSVTIAQALLHDTTQGALFFDGGLSKSGSGTLTLSASDTYVGATAVSAGTLVITGSDFDSGSASVAAGAILEVDGLLRTTATSTVAGTMRGNGIVGGINVSGGGTLAPGFDAASGSAGNLTANGSVLLSDSTSTFSIRLGVATPSGHDELTLDAGNVFLGGATLQLSFGSAYSTQPAGFIDILINGQPGDSTITGEFAQGTSITGSNGDMFTIAYGENATDTGAGNDVLLIADSAAPRVAPTSRNELQGVRVTSVPEPGALPMSLAAAGLLACWRLRRRGISG